MDVEDKKETTGKGLKVTLGVLAAVALALGVGILVVGLNFGNNDNGVKDENLITEYETVNEDGEEVIVQVRSYKPEKTESKSTGSDSDVNNESDIINDSEANPSDDLESEVDESELENEE